MRCPKTPKVLFQLLLAVVWLLGLPAMAADAPANDINSIIEKAKGIERDLRWGRYDLGELTAANKSIDEFKPRADACIAANEEELVKVKTSLDQLGARKPGESAEAAKQRRQLESDREAIEARLADCNALALLLGQLREEIEKQLKQRMEARMLARGPDILSTIRRNVEQPAQWLTESGAYIGKQSWLLNKATAKDLLWAVAILLAGFAAGLWLRRWGLPAVRARSWTNTTGGRFSASLLASASHDAPYILASLGTAIYLGVLTRDVLPMPLLTALAYGFSAYFLVNLAIRVCLEPIAPGRLFLDVPESVARPMARRFRVLMALLLLVTPLLNSVIGQGLPSFAQSLADTILRILLAINIVWVLWLFRYLTGVKRQAWFRHLLSLVLIVAVIGDLSGYSNLSGWMFRSVFGTLAALGIVSTVARLLRELLIGIEYGTSPWGRKMRRLFGLPATEQHLAGFFWVRMLVTLGLWASLAWLFILIWDLSASAVQDINRYVSEGFQVGSLKIVPSRVLLAVITLAVLIALTSWLKGMINHQLEKSPMERGSREALVTISGYSGVLIAIIAALGVAGIEFSNLAIIAGALSVGIGFGLQNIVNNFVSGLILLFERPVKTGDWIVVGGTEGHVKRIRIRSTQIETFDHADVIVPNSELIASQVTNWMLRDAIGRARIPIGVAYGSDTQKVKETLLKIANEHPEVITRQSSREPKVLFLGFGDSSLNFELRLFIKDIDHRLQVVSDINFAIDAAFREAGIEIPFPQRDLHVRNWPGPPTAGSE